MALRRAASRNDKAGQPDVRSRLSKPGPLQQQLYLSVSWTRRPRTIDEVCPLPWYRLL